MYLVIFTAELAELDDKYFAISKQLRRLAFDKYACLAFQAVNEGRVEVTTSSWSSLEDIQRWKQDPLHQRAQQLAAQWYKAWNVIAVPLTASRMNFGHSA